MFKYNKICFGGTFDRLHKGHKALIDLAFSVSKFCIIGLTSDEFAKRYRKEVESYDKRKEKLEHYLLERGYKGRYRIVTLNSFYSKELVDKNERIEAIVVGNEKNIIRRAREINKERRKKGLKTMDVLIVDMVNAYDGKRISSTRIRKGEINEEGKKA
ncbi:MAG TPA: pantetheine-phosphate adenylyltransferase [Candidatus Aenigmarchaeota archaeon]|nr:MAG: phosphopantetheine adenylyltransferase [Candidatus Aenigmarchaeota archaeon]HDD46374.1 pantetheine-phosphate adenylyltransferase [Candidatus Aenigmarchaeota archaeon]